MYDIDPDRIPMVALRAWLREELRDFLGTTTDVADQQRAWHDWVRYEAAPSLAQIVTLKLADVIWEEHVKAAERQQEIAERMARLREYASRCDLKLTD